MTQACTSTPVLPPPGPPSRLSGQVSGSTVKLSWLAPVVGGLPTGYVVEAGLAAGQTLDRLPVGLQTSLTVQNVPVGRYYTRVRAVNAAGQSSPSQEIVVSVGCTEKPGKPRLKWTVNGNIVSFYWIDADGCSGSHYKIGVGARPGASDLDLESVDSTVAVASAPAGTYYARVQTVADSGASEASNEVAVTVGTNACVAPSFETGLSAQLIDGGVGLWWNAVDPAAALVSDETTPLTYALEVGSAPGQSDVGTFAMGRVTALWTTAPAGVYYARVRPVDACGAGVRSNEVMIQVP